MNPGNRISNLVTIFLMLVTVMALSSACGSSPAPSAPAPKSTPGPTGNHHRLSQA